MLLRFFYRAGAAVLLVTLAGVLIGPAHAFDKTWEKVRSPSGGNILVCRAPACAGSLVMYRAHLGNLFGSIATFRASLNTTFADIIAGGSDVAREPARESTTGGYRHFRMVVRDVTRSTGKVAFTVVGALVSPTVSYTLVSIAPDRAGAERHYRELIDHVRGVKADASARR
jgi:hypothetical protein